MEASRAQPRTYGALERAADRLDARIERSRAYPRLESAGGMFGLIFKTARLAVTPPFTWRRDFVVELSVGLRRSMMPMVVAFFFFTIGAVAITIGGVVESLGTTDRLGAATMTGYPRETGFWLTAFVFAGVVGSANTADLAARKIREELDAIRVLGINPVRTLVVPRVLAGMVIAPVLGLIALALVTVLHYVTTPMLLSNHPPAAYFESAGAFMNVEDLISFTLRMVVAGLFVGVVSCHKGLNTGPGAEGAGRAVNQAVLITFAGLWLLNNFWNYAFLSSFPDARSPVG